jgi:hypothetical protein
MKKRTLWPVVTVLAILSFATVGAADDVDPMDNISAPPGSFALVTYFNSEIIWEIRARPALNDWWRMPENERRNRRKCILSQNYSNLKGLVL